MLVIAVQVKGYEVAGVSGPSSRCRILPTSLPAWETVAKRWVTVGSGTMGENSLVDVLVGAL